MNNIDEEDKIFDKLIQPYVCNGAMYCGFKPENAEVIEERQVLYPAEDYELQDKAGNRFSAVWLKDGRKQEDYIEIPERQEENA